MIKESIKKLLKPVSIDYEDKAHTYKNRYTGEFYTGTTTISGAWKKDFLSAWYAKEAVKAIGYFSTSDFPAKIRGWKTMTKEQKAKVKKDSWDNLLAQRELMSTMTPEELLAYLGNAKGAATRLGDIAKNTGHVAHAWIESFIKNVLDPNLSVSEVPTEEDAKNAVDAFTRWEAKNKDNIEWLGSEEVVCSDIHRVAGTLDALLNYNSILTIGDIKTSGQISEDYLLQLAGYDLQLAELGLQVRQWLIIRTPKNGEDVETLTINDPVLMQFARESFLHQRESHKFYLFAENHLKSGEGFSKKMKVDEKQEDVDVASMRRITS